MGRTGSGKSSLIRTLLRLLNIQEGQITIDGLYISRIPRDTLRSRVLTILQDPVVLPGSVRYNLNEFNQSGDDDGDDEIMQYALVRIGLWEVISKRGCLGIELQEVRLSAGQKQLFSSARTLLTARKSRNTGGIMLLDGPTSSMDEEMDMGMRKIVKEDFARFTTITISHRANAAKQADVEVRIHGGRVMEANTQEPE